MDAEPIEVAPALDLVGIVAVCVAARKPLRIALSGHRVLVDVDDLYINLDLSTVALNDKAEYQVVSIRQRFRGNEPEWVIRLAVAKMFAEIDHEKTAIVSAASAYAAMAWAVAGALNPGWVGDIVARRGEGRGVVVRGY